MPGSQIRAPVGLGCGQIQRVRGAMKPSSLWESFPAEEEQAGFLELSLGDQQQLRREMLTIPVPNEGGSENSNYSFSICVLPGGPGLVLSSLDKASLLLIKADIC